MEKLDLDSLDIDPFGLSPASVADDFTFLHERDRSGLIAEAERRGERTQLLDKPRAKLERLLEFHAMRVSAVSELIHLPKPGEQWRLVTQQHFNTFTFILDLVKRRGRIDELDIVTFNVNEPTIDALCGLFDQGRVKVLRMVISDSIKFRMPKRVLQIRAAFEERKETGRFKVVFCWNHAKIALASVGNDRYVIEGSGNFSNNAEIEQYLYENNRASYDFHRSWLTDVIFNERRGARHEVLGEQQATEWWERPALD